MSSSAERFRSLHEEFFVLPNPWDLGSARILEDLGFSALATTSSGFAQSIGREDGEVHRDELVAHTANLSDYSALPVNVDAERCFSDSNAGIAETIALLAGAGAAGISIEDWNPATEAIDPLDVAVARVETAVSAASSHGLVLTARAENLIRGVPDLDDTLGRLEAYRDVGAEVLYAPGLRSEDEITRAVSLGRPLNVLAMPRVPAPGRLAELGVVRMSTGGALARAAYTSLQAAAGELLTQSKHEGDRP